MIRASLILCLAGLLPSGAFGDVIAEESFSYPPGSIARQHGGRGFQAGQREGWKTSRADSQTVEKSSLRFEANGIQLGQGGSVRVRGTDRRNNPLRRQLDSAYSGDVLYVRFLLRYHGESIDHMTTEDGEFCVLWLDDIDGGDGATHNANVPNIGVRVKEQGENRHQNLFMVRIGSRNTAFSQVQLQGDRTYLVVGRLSKTRPGFTSDFDAFELWVDPRPADRDKPLALARGRSFNAVRWIGCSTGRKTEPDDRVWIDELALATTWEEALGLKSISPVKLPPKSTKDKSIDFRADIYPLLKSRCFACHQGSDASSGYRLDVRQEILGFSHGQPLVKTGDSRASRLMQVIMPQEGEAPAMPPDDEPLSPQEVGLLAAWIDQGLDWDKQLLPPPKIESDHWAFQPVERPAVPAMKSKWIRNPIDAFMAAKHAEQKLQPAREASRRVLLRRLSFDLTGLPPTPEELAAFEENSTPRAYQQVVEQLLQSPHYGVRWGRHWLDIARWAESNGYQHNKPRKHAWRYRDYVVESFNQDKPYDQFLKEQIAGDELVPASVENIVATGFLAAARLSGNELDERIQKNDILADIVNNTGSAVLGLTFECARCHNHKFDPVSQRDYYRFGGFFISGLPGNLTLPEHGSAKPSPAAWGFYSPLSPNPIEYGAPEIRSPPPLRREELKQARPRLLIRGDVQSPGPELDTGWPAVFGAVPSDAPVDKRPRTVLADWLTSRKNPLTARVWVNRVWQYHFGRGLVKSPGDFGLRTERPVQAKLLDWLAAEFMEQGWNTKHLHRLILNSATYRQSSAFDAKSAQIDPDNDYYWRYQPRRLEYEAIRDAILFVSGELDEKRGGPSVPPERTASSVRRSLYLFQKRRGMPRMQSLFDGAEAIVACQQRSVSTVPQQSLFLLNNDFVYQRARAFAQRVHEEAQDDLDAQMTLAFKLALGRPPTVERERFAALVRGTSEQRNKKAVPTGLVHLCHTLLNLNEFVYLK